TTIAEVRDETAVTRQDVVAEEWDVTRHHVTRADASEGFEEVLREVVARRLAPIVEANVVHRYANSARRQQHKTAAVNARSRTALMLPRRTKPRAGFCDDLSARHH